MAYFTPEQLENSGIQGLSQFNPSPGLGFSVGDIFGSIGPAVAKIFGGSAQPVDNTAQMAALMQQEQSAQQQQTYLVLGGLAVIALGLALAFRGRGKR